MFFNKKPLIEVSATKMNRNLFDVPNQSKNFLPNWIKTVKFNMSKENSNKMYPSQSVRACMPFMDAMSVGWIIPAPWDVYFEVENYGKKVNYEFRNQIEVSRGIANPPIEQHNQQQVGKNNLYANSPILKFINPWKITTRTGYSTMFINPVNHGKSYIECFAGVVDTDKYSNLVNFPFRVLNPDNKESYNFMIKAGHPIIQFFPIKRKESFGELPVRDLTDNDVKDHIQVTSNYHYYKEKIHDVKS